MVEKGQRIRFKAGNYKGCNGWLAKNKKVQTRGGEKMMCVIVDLGGGQELDTRVLTTSIGKPRTTPKSFAEAVVQQHPDIEEMMDKLCREIAKCGLSPTDPALETILSKKLTEAALLQNSAGHKARCRVVHYDEKQD